MDCLVMTSAGVYQLASPQPAEYTSCMYVLAQPDQVTANAWWALTVNQGTEIATAIAILWAIGCTYRVLINFLKSHDGDSNE
jgi:hypothetical protein